MSMLDWDLLENAFFIVVGCLILLCWLSEKSDD